MKASVNMRVVVVMMIRRDVDAVGLLERLGVHDFSGGAFAADDAVERVNPGGVAEDHGEIVRDENDGEFVAFVNGGDEFVEIGLAGGIHAGGGLVEEEQLGFGEEAERDEDALELAAGKMGERGVEELFGVEFAENGGWRWASVFWRDCRNQRWVAGRRRARNSRTLRVKLRSSWSFCGT
jgi:hypothetical protein